ncbi:MAG TPA: efflux RND transporter periplasmic adaptor subunit [Bryobacterales bacterium]|nr:efflux RND transporter periplasmic adaptor subunit [Bryobacterales bacterium]
MRSALLKVIILLAVAAAAATGYYLVRSLPERHTEIPVVQVKRGDLLVRTYVRGELRATRSVLLTTPNLGATAQVTRLAPSGALSRAKDLIVEFDDSDLLASLEDAQLEVAQAAESIKKAEADQKIRRNQDQVDLLKARYDVRRAQLEVQRNELLSAIDARKNILTLEQARKSLSELEADVKSRLQQGEAELASLREQQRKAELDVARANSRLEQTKVLAPISGLVSIKENRSGGFFFGQQLPDIREGDQLPAGMPIAEILDLSDLEVAARVNEIERANLHEGQEVLIRLDALPGKVVHGKIKMLGSTANSNLFSADPTKRFDCVFSVDMREMLGDVGATSAQVARILEQAAENAGRFQKNAAAVPAPGVPGGAPMIVAAVKPGAAPQGAPVRLPGPPSPPGALDKAPAPAGALDKAPAPAGAPGKALAPPSAPSKALAPPSAQGKATLPSGPIVTMRAPAGAPPPGPGGPPGPAGARPTDIASLSLHQAVSQKFTAEEREKAELPAPPEEHSVMDVLLRPGLLTEAEIIVEKIPNTLYVPQQAVFDKSGKTVVFARVGSRFEQRVVRLGKRTESQVAILGGLRQGDWIALQDMSAGRPQPSKKQQGPAPKPQPALPGPKASLIFLGGLVFRRGAETVP